MLTTNMHRMMYYKHTRTHTHIHVHTHKHSQTHTHTHTHTHTYTHTRTHAHAQTQKDTQQADTDSHNHYAQIDLMGKKTRTHTQEDTQEADTDAHHSYAQIQCSLLASQSPRLKRRAARVMMRNLHDAPKYILGNGLARKDLCVIIASSLLNTNTRHHCYTPTHQHTHSDRFMALFRIIRCSPAHLEVD